MEFTDWHQLFGMTLTDFFSDTAYTVELEKDLSLKKQLLDVVIIEKKQGRIPDELPDGFENMAEHNLVSYKSLHESFDDWAADELVGHFVNYRKQISPSLNSLLPKENFRLYAVCTRFPQKLEKEAALTQVRDGVYDLRWGIRNIRLIVTSGIYEEKRNAVWLMFSAIRERAKYGFSNYRGKLNEMNAAMSRLLKQYKMEGIIEMGYTIEDFRKGIMVEEALDYMTPDDFFRKFSQDDLLKKIPPKERLKGLSAEEVFKTFSPEEMKAYLKTLTKKTKAKPKKKAKIAD
jgi:hypothetical protein